MDDKARPLGNEAHAAEGALADALVSGPSSNKEQESPRPEQVCQPESCPSIHDAIRAEQECIELLLRNREHQVSRIARLNFELAQQKSHVSFLETILQGLRQEREAVDEPSEQSDAAADWIRPLASAGTKGLTHLKSEAESLPNRVLEGNASTLDASNPKKVPVDQGESGEGGAVDCKPSVLESGSTGNEGIQLERQSSIEKLLLRDRDSKAELIGKLKFELRQQKSRASFFEKALQRFRKEHETADPISMRDGACKGTACKQVPGRTFILGDSPDRNVGLEVELPKSSPPEMFEDVCPDVSRLQSSTMKASEEDASLEREGFDALMRDREEKVALIGRLSMSLRHQSLLFQAVLSHLSEEVEAAETRLEVGSVFLKSAEWALEAADDKVGILSRKVDDATAIVSRLRGKQELARFRKGVKGKLTKWLMCGSRSIQQYKG